MNINIKPEARAVNKKVIEIQKAAISRDCWQSCPSCINWTDKSVKRVANPNVQQGSSLVDTGPKCMQFNKLPPPSVIVVGCEFFEWDIPF